ncbi:hypothetical protein PFISCL1PPCAC_5958, partial [Pristionchus fissidentatus]
RNSGKKKEGTLDTTQEPKEECTGPSGGNNYDSPVISEAGDVSGVRMPESGEKDKEKKEEVKKTKSKEEMEKQAENDANYKRKVMEEVTNLARKMSREEIEEDKKDEEKKKKNQRKYDKAFSPILKEKPVENNYSKSKSDSKKKKKSKIREEINGGKKPEYIKIEQEDDHADERPHPTLKRTNGTARTPPPMRDDQQNRKRDENDDVIINLLRENKEKEQRSGRPVRAPHFDELEHPRLR